MYAVTLQSWNQDIEDIFLYFVLLLQLFFIYLHIEIKKMYFSENPQILCSY